MKSSSHKHNIKSRKVLRNSSISKEILTNSSIPKEIFSSTSSKAISSKSHFKNYSYELKPIVNHIITSSTSKLLTNNNPTSNIRKKFLNFSVTPMNNLSKTLALSGLQKKIEFPLKPNEAISFFSHELTSYEQAEILDYSEIHFIGTKINKITPKLDQINFGFDDSRGDLKLIKGDHIGYRYEILELLGKGSFGQVCECRDYKRNEKIALKIIRNKKRFHHQAGIEVSILQKLREKDQNDAQPVIKMKNYFYFRKHVCISFDL